MEKTTTLHTGAASQTDRNPPCEGFLRNAGSWVRHLLMREARLQHVHRLRLAVAMPGYSPKRIGENEKKLREPHARTTTRPELPTVGAYSRGLLIDPRSRRLWSTLPAGSLRFPASKLPPSKIPHTGCTCGASVDTVSVQSGRSDERFAFTARGLNDSATEH